jgi:hypothetical protein
MNMKNKEYIITGAMLLLITYTLGLSLVSQVFPTGQTTQTLSSTGSIQIQTSAGIGIYQDISCTSALTSIPWGTLQPGESKTFTCYIKNEGSSPTTLSMVANNWTPLTATNYISLDWDYDQQAINPNAVKAVTLTLAISSSTQGITTFSFSITIIGSS